VTASSLGWRHLFGSPSWKGSRPLGTTPLLVPHTLTPASYRVTNILYTSLRSDIISIGAEKFGQCTRPLYAHEALKYFLDSGVGCLKRREKSSALLEIERSCDSTSVEAMAGTISCILHVCAETQSQYARRVPCPMQSHALA
jgi:hypothetical protein